MSKEFKMFPAAYELAKEVHKNQKRWDNKTPYMFHIDGVIANVKDIAPLTEDLDVLLTVAALHDAHEDHRDVTFEYIEGVLRNTGADDSKVLRVMRALDAITKKETKGEETYLEYIKRIQNSLAAIIVKIADITHNKSDLKRGSMKDKYELALYILYKEWPFV